MHWLNGLGRSVLFVMNKDYFIKKFTLGINTAISATDYEKFLEKYKDYIYSIYFSPPLGDEYSTRKIYSDNLRTSEQIKNFYNILNCIKRLGIKYEVCINIGRLSEKQINDAISYMKSEILPDEIVCLDKYFPMLKDALPTCRFIYSFNNPDPLLNQIEIEKYDEAAVGKKYLFSKSCRNKLIEKGVTPRLLLNNGCTFDCDICGGSPKACRILYDNEVKKYGCEIVYARQSFWPFELKRLIENDSNIANMKFKLSTRTKNLQGQEICLKSYLQLEDIHKYVTRRAMSYYIWCGLNHFTENYYSFEYDKILEFKKERDWNWYDLPVNNS